MSATLGQRHYPDPPGCINCGAPVRVTNYALGPEVEHYDPAAGFPTRHKGTAWRHCKGAVATMPAAALTPPSPHTDTDEETNDE